MGYRLGRMLALVEKIDVSKGENRLKFYAKYYNITKRYPGVMLPLLLKKHGHDDIERLSKRDRLLLHGIRANTRLIPLGLLSHEDRVGFAEGYHKQRFIFS